MDTTNVRGPASSSPAKPSLDAYVMAHEVINTRLLTLRERAKWVAEHPTWREYIAAFRQVCEYEAAVA